MKRFLTVTAVLGLALYTAAPVSAQLSFLGKVGLSLKGGLVIPSGGELPSAAGPTTVGSQFKTGPTFGAELKFGVLDKVNLVGGFNYGFMKAEDAFRTPTATPAFTMPQLSAGANLNVGPLMGPTNKFVNPYIGVGAGLYPWKKTINGAGGEPDSVNNGTGSNKPVKKTSFGINGTAGVEIMPKGTWGFFAEGKYHFLFAEDQDAFGNTVKNLKFMQIGAGLTYYFNLKP
jgi:hypothetical protein